MNEDHPDFCSEGGFWTHGFFNSDEYDSCPRCAAEDHEDDER